MSSVLDKNYSKKLEDKLICFIPAYPHLDDPQLSYKISRKAEYAEHYLSREERLYPGKPMEIQRVLSMFMSLDSPYDAMVWYHYMGTGKSCTAAIVQEEMKNRLIDGKPRKPALILLHSGDLITDYQDKIVNSCTKDVYVPYYTEKELDDISKGVAVDLTERKKESRIESSLKQVYEMNTYRKFLKELSNNKELIEREYSNRTIVIDEAHYFDSKDNEGDESLAELYDQLHMFLHTVKNCKIIIMTGTVIWDQTDEIATKMNLILPLNRQMPVGNEFYKVYFNHGELKPDDEVPKKYPTLREAFHGRVSVLRAMEIGVSEDMGTHGPWLEFTKIYPVALNPIQYKYALEARDKDEVVVFKHGDKMVERHIKGGTIQKTAITAATMILPLFKSKNQAIQIVSGAGYTNDIFSLYVAFDSKNNFYYITDERIKVYLRGERLKEVNAKAYMIIQWLKAHPRRKAYISTEFVTGIGGAIMLGLIMQENGFIWGKTSGDISQPRQDKKRRFVVITSAPGTIHGGQEIKAVRKAYNQDSNTYAENCQFIIGSRKTLLSYTFMSTTAFFEYTPRWNDATTEQGKYRIFRVDSLLPLKPEERRVEFFRLAAVKQFDPKTEDKFYEFDGQKLSYEETIDIRIYKTVEKKQKTSFPIYRIMLEEDPLCPLSYQRNVLDTDIDGSKTCNYQKCNYTCSGFPEDLIDKSGKVWNYDTTVMSDLEYDTKMIYYDDEDAQQMIHHIKALFRDNFNMTIESIAYSSNVDMNDTAQLYRLLKVLDKIISERIIIKNSYGFDSYLKENDNLYFLDTSVAHDAKYSDMTYIKNPYAIEYTSLEDQTTILQLQEDKPKVLEFCSNPNVEILSTMNYKSIIAIAELLFALKYSLESENKNLTPKQQLAYDIVMNKVGREFYTMDDGITVHLMYTYEYTGTGYNVVVKELRPEGKMRAFDTGVNKWKYAPSELEQEYIPQIKIQREGDVNFENNPYDAYGFIDREKKFKIRIREEPGKRKTKGGVCNSAGFDKTTLIKLFIALNYFPPHDPEFSNFNRAEILRNFHNSFPEAEAHIGGYERFSDQQLLSILTLYVSNKVDMCQWLEKWFKDHNLFYDFS